MRDRIHILHRCGIEDARQQILSQLPERVTRAPVNERGTVWDLLAIKQYFIALRDQVVAINRPALSPAQILKCRCLSHVACKYIFTVAPPSRDERSIAGNYEIRQVVLLRKLQRVWLMQ